MPPLDTQHRILASHLSKVASFRFLRWEREHENICYRGKTLGHGKTLSPYTQRPRLVGTTKALFWEWWSECRTFREDTSGLRLEWEI